MRVDEFAGPGGISSWISRAAFESALTQASSILPDSEADPAIPSTVDAVASTVSKDAFFETLFYFHAVLIHPISAHKATMMRISVKKDPLHRAVLRSQLLVLRVVRVVCRLKPSMVRVGTALLRQARNKFRFTFDKILTFSHTCSNLFFSSPKFKTNTSWLCWSTNANINSWLAKRGQSRWR